MSGLPSWVRVGARVICVNDVVTTPIERGQTLPVRGVTYTVRNTFRDAIRLVEIVNRTIYTTEDGFGESAFYISRFRPAVEPKTEAEDLKAHFLPLLDRRSATTVRAPAEVSDA